MDLHILLFATLSPLLYAMTNHLDNILLSKYFQEGGVGTLMLFSALLAVLVLPVLAVVDPGVLAVPWRSRLLLFVVGLVDTLLLWAYLKAMFNDEPTVVIIYYQLVPVFGLLFGYIALGETITLQEASSMAIIIVGAVTLTIAVDGNGKILFRWRTLGYMLLASVCWAFQSTLFKVVALEDSPTRSFFWEHVSLVVIGVIMYVLAPHYRRSFHKALRANSRAILGLNVLNESLYMAGNFVAALVVVLVPVSLTLLMNSFQPLFVLALGIALTKLFPQLEVEHVNGRNVPQKIIAIALTGVGVYLLGEW